MTRPMPILEVYQGYEAETYGCKSYGSQPSYNNSDEPTAGVDVELRNKLWEYIRKLNKAGTTIILTTHYLKEAEILCDELAVINKEKL